MTAKVLLLVGSGPGIGVSVASIFAQKNFDRIALLARDGNRLLSDKAAVEKAAEAVQRQVTVKTWQVDITDFDAFKSTLEEVRQWNVPDCVYFNAARVAPSELLKHPVDEIEKDLRVGFVTTSNLVSTF